MKRAQKLIRKCFNFFGLDITKFQNTQLQAAPSPPLLYHQIDLLFDVGANIGQYALATREAGFKGKIVSFEPLSEAYDILVENSRNDPNWKIHERCAVGSVIGKAEINISKN